MGAGAVLAILGIIALFSSQNENIKEVCDRMPYTKNHPIFPGSNSDGGHHLHIPDIADGYIPHRTYDVFLFGRITKTISLNESESYESHGFTRFTINGRAVSHTDETVTMTLQNSDRVGTFAPIDEVATIHKNCHNTISESHEGVKTKAKITWKAPSSGSGCVAISAMVHENPKTWYSDDGKLTKIICESKREETVLELVQ